MIATTRPSLKACSFVSLLQVQTKSFLAVNVFSVLLDPELAFGDMADHGIHHRRTGRFRSRLHDDVPHRYRLEAGDKRGRLTLVGAHHYTWPRRRILVARVLCSCRLHHGS